MTLHIMLMLVQISTNLLYHARPVFFFLHYQGQRKLTLHLHHRNMQTHWYTTYREVFRGNCPFFRASCAARSHSGSHNAYLPTLENDFAISDQLYYWLKSHLSERSQCVFYNDVLLHCQAWGSTGVCTGSFVILSLFGTFWSNFYPVWLQSGAGLLLLNSAKTEMMDIAPSRLNPLFDNFTLSLGDYVINCQGRVKNLGVLFFFLFLSETFCLNFISRR